MTTEIWLALAATNFAASVAPGQNVALVSAATTRSGLVGGIASLAGVLLAELVWVVLALLFALGMLNVNPSLFHIMQLGGGIVLVYFGFSILRDMKSGHVELVAAARIIHYAARGVWIGLANPLALMFFIALFPSFLLHLADKPDAASPILSVPVILLSSACGLLPWMAATRVLSANKRTARIVNCISGATLLVMGTLAFVELF